MIDPTATYTEPLGDALRLSSQQVAQMISLLAAAAEVAVRRKTLHNQRQAALDMQAASLAREQEKALRAQERAKWAPAFDADWMSRADPLQTGRVWGAAVPYAETDPEAAAAMVRAEDRLRALHPYAMGHYDRLCEAGASPLSAMQQSVHLFLRQPWARPGQPAPARLPVEASLPGTSFAPEPGPGAGAPEQPSPGRDIDPEMMRHGREIAARIQARAVREYGAPLGADDLAAALSAATSLPAEVIARLTGGGTGGPTAAATGQVWAGDQGRAAATQSPSAQAAGEQVPSSDARTARTTVATAGAEPTAVQLAAQSFPSTASEGIRAVSAGSLKPAQSGTRKATVEKTRRAGTSL